MQDTATTTEEGDAMANDGTSSEGVMVGGAEMVASATIPENASNAENLTTLVAAVEQAGLVETLSGEGPFTVFAPTNVAFEELSEGTVENLMQDANQDQLSSILTYHVIAGQEITTDSLDGGETFETVNGQELNISIDEEGNYWVNGEAMIQTANIQSSNGISHTIDAVLMPAEEGEATEDES